MNTVFIVDDDPVARMIVVDELGQDDYELHEFEDGQSCLDALGLAPDIILMDVEMPGMNGYDTCRQVKENPATQDIDVVFISSHDTTAERLLGYNAGASDYIIKPIHPAELHEKLLRIFDNIKIRTDSEAGREGAMQMAMTAMTNAGELGIVIDFMRRSFATNDIQSLATLIVESFESFMVNTCVQIRTATQVLTISNNPPASPLEEELLTRLSDSGRIMEHGKRLIANFGDISLLIKNMPDDDDKAGRLRDHLAILLEGAEARLRALNVESGLAALVDDSQHVLQGIEHMHQAQKETSLKIMEEVLDELEQSFLSYGLTEDQEKKLVKIVELGVDRSTQNLEQGQHADTQLRGIIERMQVVSTGQNP